MSLNPFSPSGISLNNAEREALAALFLQGGDLPAHVRHLRWLSTTDRVSVSDATAHVARQELQNLSTAVEVIIKG